MKTNLFAIILLALLVAACQPATVATAPAEATAANTEAPTAAPTEAPTEAPEPTNTPPVVDSICPAVENSDAFSLSDAILADFEAIGCTPGDGELIIDVAVHNIAEGDDPLDIVASFQPLEANDSVYANFVLGVDVSWTAEGDSTGLCGIVIRADEGFDTVVSFEEEVNIFFITWKFLSWVGSESTNLTEDQGEFGYAVTYETNHFVLVANNDTITAFSNGLKLGSAKVSLEYLTGQIAFYSNTLGGTKFTCTFANAWIWQYDE